MPPIRGVYRGPATAELSAGVEMRRLNGDGVAQDSASSSAWLSSSTLNAPSIRVETLPSESITNSHGSVRRL